jgi:hypothetical protein
MSNAIMRIYDDRSSAMGASSAHSRSGHADREGLLLRFLQRLILGKGVRDTSGYYVRSESWPGGSTDAALTAEQTKQVLDEAFNGYFDVAMEGLAKVESKRT